MYYFSFVFFYQTTLTVFWKWIKKYDLYNLYLEQQDQPQKYCIATGKNPSKLRFFISFIFTHYFFMQLFAVIMFFISFSKYLMTIFVLKWVYLLVSRGGQYYIDFFPTKYQEHLDNYEKLGLKYDPIKIRVKSRTTKDK